MIFIPTPVGRLNGKPTKCAKSTKRKNTGGRTRVDIFTLPVNLPDMKNKTKEKQQNTKNQRGENES